MKTIGIIAFDLDGTLLTSGKRVSEVNREALCAARRAGAELVPATGRLYAALPEEVRSLPLRYVIAVNGASIYDTKKKQSVSGSGMRAETALDVMDFLETLPVIYDCYMDNWGFMTASMKEKAGDYVKEKEILRLVEQFRKPVADLRAHVKETGHSVQKIQLFLRDRGEKEAVRTALALRFPDLIITSSLADNIEINDPLSTKGHALLELAGHLGVPAEEILAFGDGTNDLSMIREAGIGVAMANAHPDVKAAADRVTLSNDEHGVAAVLRDYFPAVRTEWESE